MKIINRLGFHLPFMIRFTGYIFMIMSVIGTFFEFSGLTAGLIVFLIGGLMAFSAYGVVIKVKSRSIRQYNSFFGFRFGKWNDVRLFTDIVVLPETKSLTTYSRANLATTMSETLYCIFLYDKEAEQKVMIRKEKTEEKAMEYAGWFKTVW